MHPSETLFPSFVFLFACTDSSASGHHSGFFFFKDWREKFRFFKMIRTNEKQPTWHDSHAEHTLVFPDGASEATCYRPHSGELKKKRRKETCTFVTQDVDFCVQSKTHDVYHDTWDMLMWKTDKGGHVISLSSLLNTSKRAKWQNPLRMIKAWLTDPRAPSDGALPVPSLQHRHRTNKVFVFFNQHPTHCHIRRSLHGWTCNILINTVNINHAHAHTRTHVHLIPFFQQR